MTIQDSYNCAKCRDTGIIYDAETNTARICECQEKVRYQKMLQASGISEQFLKIGFKEFKTKTEFQKIAKAQATSYVKNFEQIEKDRNNSIARWKTVIWRLNTATSMRRCMAKFSLSRTRGAVKSWQIRSGRSSKGTVRIP